LSYLRDLTAMTQTIGKILDPGLKKSTSLKLSLLKEDIVSERTIYAKNHMLQIEDIRNSLVSHPLITRQITWSEDYFNNTLKSLTSVYKRCYQDCVLCQDKASNEDYHEWRKATKYLRYQLLILKNAWPAILIPWEKELHRLTDFLGDANNIIVLQNYLHTKRERFTKKELHQLTTISLKEHDQLIREANLLGKKLFAERPKAFSGRMEVYLTEWGIFQ
jgi:CHAD domain-containing protein